MRESGLVHLLYAPLLGNIGRDTDKQWHSRIFSHPLTRADEMCVGGKLDREIAHIHRPAIPFQPETDVLLSEAIFREPRRASDCTSARPPSISARTWPQSPTSRVRVPLHFLQYVLHTQRSHRFLLCAGDAVRARSLLTVAHVSRCSRSANDSTMKKPSPPAHLPCQVSPEEISERVPDKSISLL